MLEVVPGRYRLSFTHPRLDTLGVVGPVLEVNADGTGDHTLTMPTDEEIARSACRVQEPEPAGQPATLLYGYVRDGSSPAVVADATVTIAWRVPMPRGPTVGVRNHTLETRSDATGAFQVCGVPRETPLTVRATRGTRRGLEQRLDPIVSAVNRVDVELVRSRP